MIKVAALIVFLVLVLSDYIGIKLVLVPGLSAKNVLLYILVIWITLEAVFDGRSGGFLGRSRDYMPLHLTYIFLIATAFFSMLACVFILSYPDYGPRYGVMALKVYAVDHYLMLFVFLAAVRDSREAIWMIKAMLVTMALANSFALIDMFGGLDLNVMTPRRDGRLQGPLGSANEYGALMAFYIPLMIAFTYQSRGSARAFWAYAVLVCVTVMLFSVSRGAVLGLIGGAIIGTLLLRRYISGRHIGRALMLMACIGTVAVAVLAVEYGDLLYARFVEENISGSIWEKTSGRTEIWGDALAMMWQSPQTLLVGFGWKSFNVLNPLSAHSEYLDYFFNLGLIGLSLIVFVYFAIIYYVIVAIRSASPQRRAILIGFLFGYLSILVSNVFGNLHAPWLYIWALTGVVLRFAVTVDLSVSQQEHLDDPRTPIMPSAQI